MSLRGKDSSSTWIQFVQVHLILCKVCWVMFPAVIQFWRNSMEFSHKRCCTSEFRGNNLHNFGSLLGAASCLQVSTINASDRMTATELNWTPEHKTRHAEAKHKRRRIDAVPDSPRRICRCEESTCRHTGLLGPVHRRRKQICMLCLLRGVPSSASCVNGALTWWGILVRKLCTSGSEWGSNCNSLGLE